MGNYLPPCCLPCRQKIAVGWAETNLEIPEDCLYIIQLLMLDMLDVKRESPGGGFKYSSQPVF